MPKQDVLELSSDLLRARVLPETGACLLSLDVLVLGLAPKPVLLAPSEPDVLNGDARSAAHFAMLPFVNRATANVLWCNGSAIPVAPNTDEPLALHGVGWQGAWRRDQVSSSSCVLSLDAPSDFPFAFHAEQRIALDGPQCEIGLTLTNTGNGAIPAGLGFHPYFPRDPDTRLQFDADWFWLEGPGHMPTDAIRTPPELDFGAIRLLPERWRANCYSGWKGTATIDQPALGYCLSMEASDTLPDLMFYAPPGFGFFALEPQSHTSGQTTTECQPVGTPMRALDPGESLQGWMRLVVKASA